MPMSFVESPSASAEPGIPALRSYVGRQPIFDRDLAVAGYELLYRSAPTADAGIMPSGSAATARVLVDGMLGIGLDQLTDGRPAYLNLTREYLFRELPLPFAPRQVVLEILEDIELDAQALAAIASLRRDGFKIALDDVSKWCPRIEAALPLVNIVKVDVMGCQPAELERLAARLKPLPVVALAEKVESWECFKRCEALGFELFQGYFFERPQVVSGARLGNNRLALLRTLAVLQDMDADFARVEEIIAADPGLGLKLLRLANSSLYGFKRSVDSLRNAVVLLGRETVRDWVTLILMNDALCKPQALTSLALQRAKFCQLLAMRTGASDVERQAFTVGLFSVLDALMDVPMEEVLANLALPESICEALLRQEGATGALLTLVMRQEHGEVDGQRVPAELIEACWLEAMDWSTTVLGQLGRAPG
jgi:c-di-GMP phosphodiesterase